MIPIIRTSLRARRWTMINWSIGISTYIALNILVYKSIAPQSQSLNKALGNLPASARALFGGTSNFLSPVGYIDSKVYYLILPLLFTMLAVSLSSSLFKQEEQRGTLELLLARPISRSKVLGAKLLSALIIIVIVSLVSLAVTILCGHSIHYSLPTSRLLVATCHAVMLSLLFSAVAWLLLGLGGRAKSFSVGGATIVALGSYLISSLAGLASWLQTPAKFVPYHYYKSSAILNGQYHWGDFIGLTITTTVLLALAFIGFNRRDIG